VGIAYEGWRKVGKDRYSMVNKTLYADIAHSDKFWAGMTLKLHEKYDLSGISQAIVVGDGAVYISSHASGLQDYRQCSDQYDHNLMRTGTIEGNVDKLIVRRMKMTPSP
jgi:hypothetical protein